MSKLPQHIEESFDTLFNSLGYDHVDTCTCGFMEECKCISGRDKLKSFIATILNEERKSIAKIVRDEVIKYVQEAVKNPKSDNYIYAENIPLNRLDDIINLIKK